VRMNQIHGILLKNLTRVKGTCTLDLVIESGESH